jgi:hypothetical protein
MSKDKVRNLAASVHDRLLQLAKKQNEDFQGLFTRYCLERLLYRLSKSPHRDAFVLKGALLFALWSNRPHRPTKDVDLLGKGDNSIEKVEQVFRTVCGLPVEDDGLVFQPETIRAERIKEGQEYEGVRIHCEVRLGTARVEVQADVGFGDAVIPEAMAVSYPTLLDFPAPALFAYHRETVVAEKFQAMVILGIANSRMKDFYDLWVLARQFTFKGRVLCQAFEATFQRRRTALPTDPPVALSAAFSSDKDKLRQWQAFLKKGKLQGENVALEQVTVALRDFLMPAARALAKGEPFAMVWPLSGPWEPAIAPAVNSHGSSDGNLRIDSETEPSGRG